MISYVFFRLLALWAAIAILLILKALSELVFNNSKTTRNKLKKTLPYIAIWPLALFSTKGRKLISETIGDI
jgi:hypothetical protein